ncbi:MAG: divergent polysaccharide deacetylase family protein [Alphaproteobacteria bacterium]
MAAIALPKIKLPGIKLPSVEVGKLVRNPLVGLIGAALMFVGAVVAVFALLGPMGAADHFRAPLEPVFREAPDGWRDALIPAKGPPHTYEDVVRLSERPLSSNRAAPRPATPGAMPAFAGGALPPAPILGFSSPSPGGFLPIIAADGRTPAQVYARPFTANGRPKVALVIGGLGLNPRTTQQAIDTLPPQVTLSFVVYAEGLQGWIDMARARGHEVLLETPMEPENYPDNDPGPYTLLADGQPVETVKKLEWILSRASGYFGLTNYLGARFLGSPAAYDAFANSVRGRGLAFVDDGTAAGKAGGIPRASAERVIDSKRSGADIDQQLAALEAGALQRGQALGSGFAYPVTLEKVAAWAASVEQRGYQLAPASALTVKR